MVLKSHGLGKTVLIQAVGGVLCLSLAACGSGSDPDTSSAKPAKGESAAVEWTTAPAGYVEAGGTELPGSYPEPTKGPAKGCKIGFVTPTNSIPGIGAEIDGVKSVAKKFGCSVVVKDGQFNPQNQVTGMQSLLSEGAVAIILNPLDIDALAAPIKQANDKNIPIIAVDSPASPDAKNVEGVTSTFLQSRDVTAYAAAKAIADADPGAEVGLLYPAFPAGNLQYQVERFSFWAEKLGLTVADRADVSTDSAEAASSAVNSLLQKHRDVTAIMTFNDAAAAAAATAARSLGRNDVVVTGIGGEEGVTGLIKDGRVLMTWAYDNTRMGEEEGRAAINAAAGVTLPEKVSAPGAIITASNISSFKPQA
ncbi:sugar ABC transporter substrate-binding protein [Aeromicrobium wangtongii]|uniref:sugar ABC transporter substrate-binding protein n=1 Tax=Aeromicrobium wangtongii TaxID=2969247 RepID=UPI0020183BC7|nr:sugar ABC transporter substrate-binding protein [Aeromicrobium wangtongii]MCL3818284.1 sugar ABC transporter substrate-binding protein [Aeromicrobium wangtongii]